MTFSGAEPTETPHRSPARYLWAMLLARIYVPFHLTCPTYGTQMRTLAFITEASTVQRILNCARGKVIGKRCAYRMVNRQLLASDLRSWN